MRGGGTETVAVVKQKQREERKEGLFKLKPLGELRELRIVISALDAD